jgi:tripartite-type tricarboxylate transporter receptor subunit TctC
LTRLDAALELFVQALDCIRGSRAFPLARRQASESEEAVAGFRRMLLFVLAGAGCGMFVVEPVVAQSYPTKPIKIINPFPPGGPTEGVLRLVAERLKSAFGQPVVIENRAGGAGGTVGAKAVAGAEPDGHTLLWSTPSPLVAAPAIYKNLGYDPVKSFTPIATIFSSPHVLGVNASVAAWTSLT